MIIAAIDPSLGRTAVVRGDGKAHVVAAHESEPAPGITERFARYHDLSSRTLETVGPAIIVFIEGYSFGSKGRGTVTLGEYGGYLRARLLHRKKEIIEVPPNTLKQFVTGKGQCGKPAFIYAVTTRWGVGEGWGEDEFFAYGLYRLGLVFCNIVKPATAFQANAVRVVRGL